MRGKLLEQWRSDRANYPPKISMLHSSTRTKSPRVIDPPVLPGVVIFSSNSCHRQAGTAHMGAVSRAFLHFDRIQSERFKKTFLI
ncbi:hypothetical protein Zmor_025228 [Zophobas morio]|uniref:Uncharacterized protein n=1 Tax=Zophobas morio TaxID=2755281 RepID=A0AA38M3D4_9CUCU|nr:hypothetical protein Zmor_025228 [Zophobas morio]